MGPTPGAYNYVVTVRPPPRVSSASPRGFRCLFAHRQPRDLTSPPTRRRRAGTQTHERDAQRRRELHARRRAELDRGVRPSRVSNPPPSRRFHDPRPSPCSKKRSSTKMASKMASTSDLWIFLRARLASRLVTRLTVRDFFPRGGRIGGRSQEMHAPGDPPADPGRFARGGRCAHPRPRRDAGALQAAARGAAPDLPRHRARRVLRPGLRLRQGRAGDPGDGRLDGPNRKARGVRANRHRGPRVPRRRRAPVRRLV